MDDEEVVGDSKYECSDRCSSSSSITSSSCKSFMGFCSNTMASSCPCSCLSFLEDDDDDDEDEEEEDPLLPLSWLLADKRSSCSSSCSIASI